MLTGRSFQAAARAFVLISFLAAAAASPSAASAGQVTITRSYTLNVAITDNSTPGVSDTIPIDTHGPVMDVTVRFNIVHSYVGNLTIGLTHTTHANGGTQSLVFVIFYHVGGSAVGDSSNLDGEYRINDAFTGDLWAVADGLANL